jgi:hypothetical protein
VKKGDYIFVYGTLRRGERADLSRHETEFGVKYLNTDTINGVIHNLGGFPGLKRDGVEYKFDSTAPQVTGEVHICTAENVSKPRKVRKFGSIPTTTASLTTALFPVAIGSRGQDQLYGRQCDDDFLSRREMLWHQGHPYDG